MIFVNNFAFGPQTDHQVMTVLLTFSLNAFVCFILHNALFFALVFSVALNTLFVHVAKNALCEHERRCQDYFVKGFLSTELSHN